MNPYPTSGEAVPRSRTTRRSAPGRRTRRSAPGRRTRWAGLVGAGAAAALLAGVLPGTAAGAPTPGGQAAGARPPAASADTGPATRVTLVTGDVVSVHEANGRRTVAIAPAAREDGVPVTFSTYGDGDHYYVIPSDAYGYLAAGTLDRALFDVTTLADEGYTAASGPPPVIMQYRGTPRAHTLASRADALPGPAAAQRTLASIHAVAVDPGKNAGGSLWADITRPAARPGTRTARLASGVRKVWLDARTHAVADENVTHIGAPEVWAAGYDGTGVDVAVLDTGIDPTHPDLAGKVVAEANFSEEGSTVDGNGHGTHVASIVAGTGAASNGTYEGVAPGASLMVGKVLNDDGRGVLSWAIDGMEWAAQHGADVVNMSLTADPTDGTDPASQAVDALSEETGTLFVVASGNDYSDAAIGTPGAATDALTVGAMDNDDVLANFSNRGPRRGDAAVKPNITAPGVDIVAARAAGTSLGSPVNEYYTSLSGTSMATPHVAGSAVLLKEAHPDWDFARLKDALVSTAVPGDYTVYQQGAGRVDVARAYEQQVYGAASADFGELDYPTTDPKTRSLTYRNDTDVPVTLQLTVSGQGWDGDPVAAGTTQLSTDALTVPAHDSASVDLTLDTAQLAAGVFGGVVAASTADGSVTLHTPWSLYESGGAYDLDASMLDRRGGPAEFGLPVWLVKVDPGIVSNDPFRTWTDFAWTDASGHVSFDVPPGVYDVYAQVTTWNLRETESTIAIASEVEVAADTAVTLDARDAKLRNPRVGEPVDLLSGKVSVIRHTPDGRQFGVGAFLSQSSEWKLYTTPTPDPRLGSTESYTHFTLGSELVRVRTLGGHVALHPEYWPHLAGPVLAGHRRLPVAFAGGGSEDELRSAAGKLALVRIEVPDDEPYKYAYALGVRDDVTDRAVALGVEGVLFYVDVPGAMGMQVRAQPILQLGLSLREGEQLRRLVQRAPRVRLDIRGRRSPARVYHLRLGYDGGYPETGPPVIHRRELTSIPHRFHSDTGQQDGMVAWFPFAPGMATDSELSLHMWAPAAWTDLVASRGQPLRWKQDVWLEDTELQQWSVFRPGRELPAEDWFEAPVRYGALDVQGEYPTTLRCTNCRQGDKLVTGQYRMDASGRHYQFAWYDPPQVRLFQGATEIPAQGSSWKWFQLQPGDGTYRLTMDYTQPGSADGALAPHVHSAWVFRSVPPEDGQLPPAYECPIGSDAAPCAFQPLIQLRYDLGLSLGNTAPADSWHTLRLHAGPPSGAVDGTPVSGAEVWYSTDGGQTWQDAYVGKAGHRGDFRVVLRHPSLDRTDGFVWLRVHAWNRDGGSVDETVERAYRLD